MSSADKTSITITALICITIIVGISVFPMYYLNKANIIAKSPDPIKTACALEADSSSSGSSRVLLLCERPK